jgi:hypothetical protein
MFMITKRDLLRSAALAAIIVTTAKAVPVQDFAREVRIALSEFDHHA